MLLYHGVLRDPTFGVLGAIDDNYRAGDFVVQKRFVKPDGSAELQLEVSLAPDMPTSAKGLQPRTMRLINVPERACDYLHFRKLMFLALNYPELGL
jgi:hypothetical protein